jgi:hypothetical protein
METIMIKKRLTKAANRSFGLIAAMLMRRAIGGLTRLDEISLAEAGLSRAAVADFLASPLGTDPHKFFSRRHAQDNAQPTNADLKPSNVSTAISHTVQRHADGAITFEFYRACAGRLRHTTILHVIRQMVGLRVRVLTAGILIAVGALSACSGTVPDRDAVQISRDRPPRCRLRPDSFPLSPNVPSKEHTMGLQAAVSSQQRASSPEARAGPPGLAG